MYVCGCSRSFAQRQSLEQHKMSTGHHYCIFCCRFFKTTTSLDQHKNDKHYFPCPGCAVVLPTEETCILHQVAMRHCYCADHDRCFGSTGAMEQHNRDKHNHPCPGCSSVFFSEEALCQHQMAKRHCYCSDHDRCFGSTEALEQHNRVKHYHPCPGCSSVLLTEEGLRQHQMKERHCYCPDHDRCFGSSEALEQHNRVKYHRRAKHHHNRDTHRYPCPGCSSVLLTRAALYTHQFATKHCYCLDHGRFFRSAEEMERHLNGPLHATGFRCCDCDRSFGSEKALEKHLGDNCHGPSEPSSNEDDLICPKSREPESDHASQQHLDSPIHLPLASFHCVSKYCNRTFSTPAGIAHHLKSGTCTSSIDRGQVKRLIVAADTDNPMIKPKDEINEQLLTANKQLEESDRPSDHLDTSSTSTSTSRACTPRPTNSASAEWTVMIAETSQRRCLFCPSSQPPFCNEEALINHLQSPAHCDPFMFCPVPPLPGRPSMQQQFTTYFTALIRLAQHLESRQCSGGNNTLRKVFEYLEGRFRAHGLITGLMPWEIKELA